MYKVPNNMGLSYREEKMRRFAHAEKTRTKEFELYMRTVESTIESEIGHLGLSLTELGDLDFFGRMQDEVTPQSAAWELMNSAGWHGENY